MEEVDYAQLEKRLGRDHLARRLRIQSQHTARLFGSGRTWLHIENIRTLHRGIRKGMELAGIYQRGHENSLAVQVERQKFTIPGLPPAFDGFTLLHISDTHIDGNPDLEHILCDLVRDLEYDICVITGDLREGTFEDYRLPSRRMSRLRQNLSADTYAVLGNHDCIEMTPHLEDAGIRLLLNEHVALERNGETLYLTGVDDPHYYETDHLEKAMEGIPDDGISVLLAHSPELAQEAASAGVNLYCCGHTHGGQICLPGGRPLLANARCPRDRHKGVWRFREMHGYTSRGAGTSSVAVRFNCPPEIALHTLRAGKR